MHRTYRTGKSGIGSRTCAGASRIHVPLSGRLGKSKRRFSRAHFATVRCPQASLTHIMVQKFSHRYRDECMYEVSGKLSRSDDHSLSDSISASSASNIDSGSESDNDFPSRSHGSPQDWAPTTQPLALRLRTENTCIDSSHPFRRKGLSHKSDLLGGDTSRIEQDTTLRILCRDAVRTMSVASLLN